jgi:pimeloyl-ACP methyl ester carboxylesterase
MSQGRFIDTSAGRVFIVERGPVSGPPVVFLHGFMMSQFIWGETLRILDGGRRMVAIDLPGFGESDRPDPSGFAYDLPSFAKVVAEVLDTLRAPVAEFVGHSLGGAVALTLAGRSPDRVSRLALISPAILPLPLPLEGRLLLTPGLGRLLWGRLLTRAEVRRQMLRDHFRDPTPVTDDFVDYVWARLNRPGGREAAYAVIETLGALREDNPDIDAVRAPTLLIWPDEDRVVPSAIGRRLQARIANADMTIVPACGHNTPLERPVELGRLLTRFLAAPQNLSRAELRG